MHAVLGVASMILDLSNLTPLVNQWNLVLCTGLALISASVRFLGPANSVGYRASVLHNLN